MADARDMRARERRTARWRARAPRLRAADDTGDDALIFNYIASFAADADDVAAATPSRQQYASDSLQCNILLRAARLTMRGMILIC